MFEIFIVIAGIFFFIYMIKQDKKNRKKIDERNRKIDEKYEVQEEEILAEKETNISYNVPAKCPYCQSTSFDLPYNGYIPKDEEDLKCLNCGKLSKFSALKQAITDEEVEKIVKKIFNNFE